MASEEQVARQNRFNNLSVNLKKICGYLADHEIDKAIESEDFSFIWNTLYDYFSSKDPGYLLTKFEEEGLKGRVEDVDFSLEEWYRIKEEMLSEHTQSLSMGKEEYILDLVKKRKNDV